MNAVNRELIGTIKFLIVCGFLGGILGTVLHIETEVSTIKACEMSDGARR